MPHRRFAKIMSAALLAVLSAAFGIYVLHMFPTTLGLVIGSTAVTLALAVAFPTPFHDAVTFIRTEIVPTVLDAVKAKKGGDGT